MLCKNNFDQITEALRYSPLSRNIITTMASSDAPCCISCLKQD